MNRSMLMLPAIAIVCCVGLPLLFGGAGLSVLMVLKGGPVWVILIGIVALAALVAMRGYRKRISDAK